MCKKFLPPMVQKALMQTNCAIVVLNIILVIVAVILAGQVPLSFQQDDSVTSSSLVKNADKLVPSLFWITLAFLAALISITGCVTFSSKCCTIGSGPHNIFVLGALCLFMLLTATIGGMKTSTLDVICNKQTKLYFRSMIYDPFVNQMMCSDLCPCSF